MRTAARRGLARLRNHKKAVLLLYLLNAVVALTLLPGLVSSLDSSLGTGDYRQIVAENLDLEWLEVYRSDAESPLAETLSPMVTGAGPLADHLQRWLDLRIADLPWSLLAPAVLFWFLYALLSGGALASAALDPRGSSWREYFRTAAEFWGRFLRLGILSGFVFLGISRLVLQPAREYGLHWATELASDPVDLWANLAGYTLVLLAFVLLRLVFGYARVIAACEDRRSILLALLSALAFCRKRMLPVLFLGGMLLVLLTLWGLLHAGVVALLPENRMIGIIGIFLVSQTALLGYLGLRYWYQLSAMDLFQSSREHAPPPE